MSFTRVQLLLLQRDESWNQEEWIAPLAVALDGVTAEVASWKPGGSGNSIWETLLHMNYYNERMLKRLIGEPLEARLPSNDATFEGAGGAKDEDGWRETARKAHELSAKLREVLAGLADEDLDKPIDNSTFGKALASWMLHDAYHCGQVVLIRRQLGNWRT
jgi:uncharacterized damage-inducible protein DinB